MLKTKMLKNKREDCGDLDKLIDSSEEYRKIEVDSSR